MKWVLQMAATSPALSSLLRQWQALSEPGRLMVKGGALLLLAAWLIFWVWLPAHQARSNAMTRIPELEAQWAAMRVQAQEIRQLNSAPAVVSAATRFLPADSAALRTLFGVSSQVEVQADRQFRVVISSIGYTALLDALSAARRQHRLRAVTLELKSIAKPGNASPRFASATVSAELVLAEVKS